VWRAVSGQRVHARLIGQDGDMVRLELKDGKRIEINRMRLTMRDRKYLLDAKVHKPAPLPQDAQPAEDATPTEPEERPDEIVTRTFPVCLDALGLGGGDTAREIIRLLSGQGIEFKEATDVRYNAGKETLTFVNKRSEMEKIERLLARMKVGTGKARYRMQLYKLSPQKVEKMKRFLDIQARWGRRIELKGEMETAIAEFKRIGKGTPSGRCEVVVPCGERFRRKDQSGKGAATFSGSSYVFPSGGKASLTLSAEVPFAGATAPVSVTVTAEPTEGQTFIVMAHGEVAGSGLGKARREYVICEVTLVDIAQ